MGQGLGTEGVGGSKGARGGGEPLTVLTVMVFTGTHAGDEGVQNLHLGR